MIVGNIVAFRSAKVAFARQRYFRGAKGDYGQRGTEGPLVQVRIDDRMLGVGKSTDFSFAGRARARRYVVVEVDCVVAFGPEGSRPTALTAGSRHAAESTNSSLSRSRLRTAELPGR